MFATVLLLNLKTIILQASQLASQVVELAGYRELCDVQMKEIQAIIEEVRLLQLFPSVSFRALL